MGLTCGAGVGKACGAAAAGAAAAGAVLMGADGSFDVDVTLTAAPCTGRYAVITYPGSGAAANPGEENEIPVTFAAPA